MNVKVVRDILLRIFMFCVSYSSHTISKNRGRDWNGVLRMNEDEDEPMLNLNDIEDDDDQLLDLENSLAEEVKPNV